MVTKKTSFSLGVTRSDSIINEWLRVAAEVEIYLYLCRKKKGEGGVGGEGGRGGDRGGPQRRFIKAEKQDMRKFSRQRTGADQGRRPRS